jgi:hypothetical protein
MAHLQLLISELHSIPVLQPTIRHKGLTGRESELAAPLRDGIEQKAIVRVRAFDRQRQVTRHPGHRTDMIEMPVRYQDLLQVHAGIGRYREHALGFATRVHDRCPTAGFAAQQ